MAVELKGGWLKCGMLSTVGTFWMLSGCVSEEGGSPVSPPSHENQANQTKTQREGAARSDSSGGTTESVVSTALDSYQQVVKDTPSLNAYFTFDSGNAASTVGETVGTEVGTVAYAAGVGGLGQALSLNGQGFISLGIQPAFDFVDGTGTIEAWVRPEWTSPPAGNPSYFSNRASTNGDRDTRVSLHFAGDKSKWYIWNGSTVTQYLTNGGQPPTSGTGWHHVVMVFNAGKAEVFWDGVSQGQKDQPLGSTGWPSQIGAANDTYYENWVGQIDEFSFFNDALSADTVRAHFNAFAATLYPCPLVETLDIPLNDYIEGVAFNEATGTFYAMPFSSDLYELSRTGSILRTFKPGHDDGYYTHSGWSIDPETGDLLMLRDLEPGAFGPGAELWRVDLAAETGALELDLNGVTSGEPAGLEVRADNGNYLVLDYQEGAKSVIEIDANGALVQTVIGSDTLAGLVGADLAYNPVTGQLMLATSTDGSLYSVDLAEKTLQFQCSAATGGGSFAYLSNGDYVIGAPDGLRLYDGNNDGRWGVSVSSSPLPGWQYFELFEVDHSDGEATSETDYQVMLELDTATLIEAGKLNPDCSDLRVTMGDSCTALPLPFWVADNSCNTENTQVWFKLAEMPAGASTFVAVHYGNTEASSLSNGPAVFPSLFDDFSGTSLNTALWKQMGNGTMVVADGILTAQYTAAIQSISTPMQSGETLFGVRTNLQAGFHDDVAMGAADYYEATTSTTNLHPGSNRWRGGGWYDYTGGVPVLSAGNTFCAEGQTVSSWTNPPGTASYYNTEYFYEIQPNGSTRMEIYDNLGVLRSQTPGNANCSPPDVLPVFFMLDYRGGIGADPVNSLDYAYVRNYTPIPPILRAYPADPRGDADGDGTANYIEVCELVEVCDGRDNDGDNLIDEGVGTQYYADLDEDGYGDPANGKIGCTPLEGYTTDKSDCNDSDGAINVEGTEVCDEKDNDCDGETDEGFGTLFYVDADNDGFGDAGSTRIACSLPSGYAVSAGDCNDNDNTVNPEQSEVCDEKDNDCDEAIDEGVGSPFYADSDDDGFGVSSSPLVACSAPEGYAANDGDCNDEDNTVNPEQSEVCDEKDNDCDDDIDEGAGTSFYADEDDDGFGVSSSPLVACSAPTGYVANDDDCNDDNSAINPDQSEVCDAVDNDCDGDIDDGVTANLYIDQDGDGYGTGALVTGCPTEGYVGNSDDCDDSSASTNPQAEEICDDKDNNCDNAIDEGEVCAASPTPEIGGGACNCNQSTAPEKMPAGLLVLGMMSLVVMRRRSKR